MFMSQSPPPSLEVKCPLGRLALSQTAVLCRLRAGRGDWVWRALQGVLIG